MSIVIGGGKNKPQNLSIPRYIFLEVKAFGDLTVTAAVLRTLPQDMLANCSLLVAPHLIDLVAVLRPACAIELLNLSENIQPPALFDIKKRGILAGIQSALSLRRAIAKIPQESILVMHKSTERERFIVGEHQLIILPPAENIYLAYKLFFLQCFSVACAKNDLHKPLINRRIALCPFSRMASKNLPFDLVVELARICTDSGFELELLLLEGECFDYHLEPIQVRIIPRRFDALADNLQTYAGVISADSLSAHLAEYKGVPVFVVSPLPNRYWLPLGAFRHEFYGIFSQRIELKIRLQHFLVKIQA